MESLSVGRLLEIYFKQSTILLGKKTINATETHNYGYSPDSNFLDITWNGLEEAENNLKENNVDKTDINNEEILTNESSPSVNSSKPVIPKLNITPLRRDTVTKLTRSSRYYEFLLLLTLKLYKYF